MSFIYKQSEPALWTVGHYDGNGKWIPESDHDSPEEAASRVRHLNGGESRIEVNEVAHLRTALAEASAEVQRLQDFQNEITGFIPEEEGDDAAQEAIIIRWITKLQNDARLRPALRDLADATDRLLHRGQSTETRQELQERLAQAETALSGQA